MHGEAGHFQLQPGQRAPIAGSHGQTPPSLAGQRDRLPHAQCSGREYGLELHLSPNIAKRSVAHFFAIDVGLL